jgi:phage shock protein PspC (stress-responsive transcriptional regulator)
VRLLIVLVALTGLAFAYGAGWPDVSRLGLTQSVALHDTLRIDRYASQTRDRARHGDHWYSDKAPGISLLALPPFEAMRALHLVDRSDEKQGIWHDRALLMAARLLTGGFAFVLCVLLVGIAADTLRPGTAVPVAATFALATMALPLAATVLGHTAAGAAALAAFLLARKGRAFPAGVCAGAAVVFEYQAAIVAVAVAVFLLWRSRSPRAIGLYGLGALPLLVLLGAYDLSAFGSPFHVSYRYVVDFPQQQNFFGVGSPTLHGLREVLVGHRGLLVFSPVLLLAAAGLGLLWRRGLQADAVLCGSVSAAFVLLAAGYYDPLGGLSPGPRLVMPALPFLVLGLCETFPRWPVLSGVVALVSVGGMVYQAGTYGPNFDFSTVWWWLGVPRPVGFTLVALACCAALGLAAQALRANAISVSEPDG